MPLTLPKFCMQFVSRFLTKKLLLRSALVALFFVVYAMPSSAFAVVLINQTANPASVASVANVATYSTVSIGTASTDRIISVVVGAEFANATPSGVTIDYGSGAVAMTAGTTGNFTDMYARVFYLAVPTGTTATIVVTFSGSISPGPGTTANHIAVYSVTGADTVLSTQGGNGSTNMSTTPLTTGSVTIPTGGGFLGVATGATAAGKTWASVTEVLDVSVTNFEFTTATSTAAGTATRTVTGASGEDGALSYVIFKPVAAPTVTTSAATNIATISATIGGNITALGGVTPTTRGFATSTVSTLATSVSTSTESGSFSTGAWTAGFSNTNLVGNTTYYYRAYATNTIGTGYGAITSFLTKPDVPGTPGYGTVTPTTISVNWTTPTGGATTYNLERCITSTTTCTLTTAFASSPQTISSLTANTSYDFAVQAVNATGVGAWSATSTQVTATAAPTVTTSAATSVATLSATIGGNITATGGANSTVRGFATSTVSTLATSVSTSTESGSFSTGTWTSGFSNANLVGNTTYYYRAYGTNPGGTGFGAITSFLTLPDVPGTPTYSSVTTSSVSVSWSTPTGGATTYTLERCITSTTTCTRTTLIASSPQSVGSLTSGASYDFAVQAVNATGVSTWSATSTQVITAAVPTVTTSAATSVATLSATIGGNITATGGATPTVRGFATSTNSTLASSVSTSTESGSFSTGAWTAGFSNTNLVGNTTYYYRAYATNSGGTGYGAITSFLTLPSAPGTPTFNNVAQTAIDVSWSTPTGGATTYTLERCITSTTTCTRTTLFASSPQTISSLTAGTSYDFAVQAVNATGVSTWSATSTQVTASLPTVTTTAIVTSNITANTASVAGNITNIGTDNPTVRGFASSTSSTMTSGVATSTESGSFSAGVFSGSMGNLTGNTTYYFRAYATNSTGAGFGGIQNFLTLPDTPGTPTFGNIAATSLDVSWSTPTGGATTYNIERCITSTTTCTRTTLVASSPQSISSLTAGTSYDFAVQAVNATGAGVWSATSTQTTASPPTVTTTVVDSSTVTANSAAIAGNITSVGSGNATVRGFASSTSSTMTSGVATSTESGSFTTGAFTGSMGGLTGNTTYYYRAYATNAGGTSFGAISSLLTLPGAPESPTYNGSETATTTAITWVAPTGGAASYKLEQCVQFSSTCSLYTGITGNSTTTYSLVGNTNYVYAVRATNATGDSAFSATSTALLTFPDIPGAATFSNITTTSALASWDAPVGGAAEYQLEFCDISINCSLYTNILSNSTTTYSLSVNSTYTVAVRATNAAGVSYWSATSTLVTTVEAPGTPTYLNTTATTTDITWTASSGATSYKLEQCVTATNTCSLFIGITDNSTTTYSLVGNTSYDYAVRGTASGTDGAFSATSTILTLPNVSGIPSFTNITATTLTVSWTGAVGSSSSYKIERCSGVACSDFTEVASSIGTTTYNDSGLSGATTYLYRIRGTNTTGDGLYSVAASVTTGANSGSTGGGKGGGGDAGGNAPGGNGDVGGGGGGVGADIGTDPNFFTPASNATASGFGAAWGSATDAYVQDSVYATAAVSAGSMFYNFGFTVPSGNTIVGIAVKVLALGTTAAGSIAGELSWDGGSTVTSSGNTTGTLTTSGVVYTLGSATSVWGRTWSPSEFSGTNFRVRLVAAPSSNTLRIDAIQVRVYHQTSGGGGGGGGDI